MYIIDLNMGLSRRASTNICAQIIYTALTGATIQEKEDIKNTLNISGFCYSGSGFVLYGDNIQIDNNYILDAGNEN